MRHVHIGDVEKLFDEMPLKDDISLSTVIKGYA